MCTLISFVKCSKHLFWHRCRAHLHVWQDRCNRIDVGHTFSQTDRLMHVYDSDLFLQTRYKRALGPWVTHLRMTDQWSGTICEILVECIMRNNSVNFFLILGKWFRICCLKISYLELWQSSCLVQQNHLCNFERWHHEEYSCEVIWNLDQYFKRRCWLKTFLI